MAGAAGVDLDMGTEYEGGSKVDAQRDGNSRRLVHARGADLLRTSLRT